MTGAGMDALCKVLILASIINIYIMPWRGIKELGFLGWLKEFVITPFVLIYFLILLPFVIDPLKYLARKFGNS